MATQAWEAAMTITAAAAAGMVVGAVIGGGRLVRVYDWTTEWAVDASPAEVFALFNRPEEQDRWWPSMAVERTSVGPHGTPRSVTYRVIQAPSVRRFAPPFVLHSTQTDVEQDHRIRAVVTGDLSGVLETLLFATPAGGTRIVFHWYVRIRNPVLNLAGYFATRLFRASHDHVMQEGETGLRAYFARHAARVTPGSTPDSPAMVSGERP